jgi:DNA-binding PadR family transcriptional regulator
MHPYEMKTLMRERGHDLVIKLAGGSLYDTVERLEKGGFIESFETSREGRRPERTVYALTESGRDELQLWMKELIAVPAKEFPQFAAALAFLGVLGKEDAVQFLQRRIVVLEGQIAAAESELKATHDLGIPRLFTVEADYGRAMARAELAWVQDLVHQIKDGDLWLTHEQMKTVAERWSRPKEVSD